MQPMNVAAPDRISRWVHYRRQLQSGDFSLEANTDDVPEDGHFYVLQAGRVVSCSDDFGSAEGVYLGLCRDHWRSHLASSSPSERMASAWGLLGLEPTDADAVQVIEQDGTPEDRKRLLQMKNRRNANNRRAGTWGRR